MRDQELIALHNEVCFGPPMRDPKGEEGTSDGKNRYPLGVGANILTADVLIGGERPLICPYRVDERGGIYCKAWVGVAKSPTSSDIPGKRYPAGELRRCVKSIKISNVPSDKEQPSP